jgi:hypothetical protein
MSTIVHERIAPPRAILAPEFGYTLGWDLVTYHRPDGEPLGRVVSLCPERALVVLDGPTTAREAERGMLVFPRASGIPPVPTVVVHRPEPAPSGDWVVTLRLELSLSMARRQLTWLHERVRTEEALPPDATLIDLERIVDSERIDRILRMLCEKRSPAVIIGSRTGRAGRPLRALLEPPGMLLAQWERSASVQAPLRVAAQGYNSVYEFVWPDSSGFTLSTAEIIRRRRRRFRRGVAPPRVHVAFRHPLETTQRLVRQVHDVSFSGLSFATRADEDVLYPGLHLELVVGWKGGPSWQFTTVVRHCTALTDNTEICGVELLHTDEEQRRAWCREIEALLNPYSERWVDASTLWRLYEDSGYFGLSGRTASSFAHLRETFASKGVGRARGAEVLVHFGVRGPNRLECAMSQVEAWSGSWLGFQGARHPQERPLGTAGDDVLRAMYVHAYENVACRPSARYLVTYIQDAAYATRWSHLAFGQRLAESGRASVTPFRALELQTGELSAHQPSSVIDLARPEERAAAHAWFAKHRPAHYVAATGVEDARLELGAIERRWRTCGLERAREVFVARNDDGVAEAVLIAERADPGVHLFGLLDVARFVPLVETGRRHLRDLLSEAARWHAHARRRRFAYFEENPHAPLPDLGGMEDLGLAYVVAMPIALLPELLEHIYEITTPRPRR